jgi:ADP-ribose pyrophosphatase YjhB (NUDIX family)
MSDKILWKNQWVEICLKDEWYTYSRNRDGVFVLGYRVVEGAYEYLVRLEHNPCHSEGLISTSLTGGIEKGSTPTETAVRELKEESGYEVSKHDLVNLGWVFPSKFSSDKTYMYAVDLTGLEAGVVEGDGTRGEEGAYCVWASENDALWVSSPLLGCAMARLKKVGEIDYGFK